MLLAEAALLDNDSVSSPNPPRTESVILRLVWMGAIPAILLCVVFLADKEVWTLGLLDVVLLLFVVVAVGARSADALLFAGTTARGEPATRAHVVGYAIRLVLITSVAWFVAQSVTL
jgi:hypothetical protein